MVMIYFQDHHLLFTMRTDQRIIAKRRKDRSTPPVKTTESMPFFFRNSEMEFFINGTMSGIKAAITDHLEMFFRDVPDKAFDKIHDRNGFLNVLIIFVTIVMERDKITGIRIDPGSGNDRATKIPANIFGNSLRVTTVGFGINIEAVFMFQITTGRNFFKRRTDAEQHFLEESSTESIAKDNTGDGMKETVKERAILQEKITEGRINGKNAMTVSDINELKGHRGSAIHGIFITAGRAETAVTTERNKLEISAVDTAIHGTTIRRITTVDHLIDIFHLSRSGMKSIFDLFIMICKDLL